MGNNTPDLSVIIITPDAYETIRKTINAIKKQTVISRIELIIVAPKALIDPNPSEFQEFQSYHIVKIEQLISLGLAKVTGIREAGAPVIALIEEHVYPDPGWAEALINAHQQSWAVVGPAVRNAEPKNMILDPIKKVNPEPKKVSIRGFP